MKLIRPRGAPPYWTRPTDPLLARFWDDQFEVRESSSRWPEGHPLAHILIRLDVPERNRTPMLTTNINTKLEPRSLEAFRALQAACAGQGLPASTGDIIRGALCIAAEAHTEWLQTQHEGKEEHQHGTTQS